MVYDGVPLSCRLDGEQFGSLNKQSRPLGYHKQSRPLGYPSSFGGQSFKRIVLPLNGWSPLLTKAALEVAVGLRQLVSRTFGTPFWMRWYGTNDCWLPDVVQWVFLFSRVWIVRSPIWEWFTSLPKRCVYFLHVLRDAKDSVAVASTLLVANSVEQSVAPLGCLDAIAVQNWWKLKVVFRFKFLFFYVLFRVGPLGAPPPNHAWLTLLL